MPTKKEADTVAKLILVVTYAFADKPGFSKEMLKPLADEAVEEAQKMLASWGASR